MSWIRVVPEDEAGEPLRSIYERVRGPGGRIDNVLRLHGLRPHTLEAHMALYKAVLHHPDNRLPRWLLETVGVYVSVLNGCAYCVEHHLSGLERLVGRDRAREIRRALEGGTLEEAFEPREVAALRYARRLTRSPAALAKEDVEALRAAGLDDGEILEVNQVASYFAYVNRTVQGLGATTAGETPGLSPSGEDPEDWRHA